MKIDKYEKTGKSKYRLYLNNGEVIDIYDNVILKNNLLLKQELDTNLYQKILIDSNREEYYNSCLKYLSIRVRSTKEIIEYLKRKNASLDDTNIIINRLIEEKLLDDNYFCKCFIKDKLKFTNMGDYKIIYELKKHNIKDYIIEQNRHLITPEILIEKIDKIILKKISNTNKIDKNKLRNKLYNHLLNAGYSSNLVVERLNKYF